jgi:hypothetical protein
MIGFQEFVERVHHTQPFAPFRLHMRDGRVYEVRDPAWVRICTHELVIFFPYKDQPPPRFSRYEVADYQQIARVELIAEAASAGPA